VRPFDGLTTRTGHPEVELRLTGGTDLLVTARYVRSAGPRTPVTSVLVSLRGTAARARHELDRADLVATVAHELRSPLTSVKGFTKTLLARWGSFTDEQRLLMLTTVEADADRVTRLITELLDVGRIDSGRLQLRSVLVDLPALAARQVGALVASGERPGRFAVTTVGDLPETWADADKVAQVLDNLLGNAVRHGAGSVVVTLEPSGEGTLISVSDEGPGVPEENLGQVFGRFWRSGRPGGTGLGLYVVRGLVEAHGGSVGVRRADSGGALFTVYLPAGVPPG
jgi:signal transduction histidine kinase